MSHDLYVYPETFDLDAFHAYFRSRPHYQDSGDLYQNEDTGAYFMFHCEEAPENIDEGEEPRPPHILFNVNFFRPHTFGLEAEIEIRAFVERFNCRIEDPQNDGMGDGPYSREGFLKSWNQGNRFGFSAMGEQSSPPPPWGADPALVEAIWKWNYGRARLQETRGDNVFVPKVVWLRPSPDAAPVACATWTQGVPTIMPENLVTHLVLVRPKRRSLFKSMFSRSKESADHEIKLAGMESGIRLRGVEREQVEGVTLVTTPAQEPLDVAAMFAGACPTPQIGIVQSDEVCGADLVELMRKKA